MKKGGSRRAPNTVPPAQSVSSMPVSRGTSDVDPSALEITTTCSCVAYSTRKETFTFPNVNRQSFCEKKKNQKIV